MLEHLYTLKNNRPLNLPKRKWVQWLKKKIIDSLFSKNKTVKIVSSEKITKFLF